MGKSLSVVLRGMLATALFPLLLPLLALVEAQDPCSPSPCGPGAECQVRGGSQVLCSCPPGLKGDPISGCEAECYQLSDCPFDRQCQGTPGQCVDPCLNDVNTGRPPCGVGADCKAERYEAVCSCPRDFTGDPFVSCRPFTQADLCVPSPCGRNAFCEPGTDKRTGEDRPVCLCNEGFVGNGVTGCTRGECTSGVHSTCPFNRACYASRCIDPCGPTFCGGGPCCNPTANCRPVDHKAECSCPPGTQGEPRTGGSCLGGSRGPTGGIEAVVSEEELCSSDTCGVNAVCKVGREGRPICTCPRGYRGNALVSCRRGE